PAADSIRDLIVTGVQTCALPISRRLSGMPKLPPMCFCQPPLAIDVRAPREREQKHIGGSLGIPLTRLVENLETLPKSRPRLVYCAGGYRSSIAASLLQGSGITPVSEIAGGIAAWEAAKLPICSAQV